jgi:hypothetical protein
MNGRIPGLVPATLVMLAAFIAVGALWRSQQPALRVDALALGPSELGRMLAEYWTIGDIERRSRQLLGPVTGRAQARERARQIGMQCGESHCRYRGRIDYTLSPAPTDGQARRSVQIDIVLDLTSPAPRLTVHRLDL